MGRRAERRCTTDVEKIKKVSALIYEPDSNREKESEERGEKEEDEDADEGTGTEKVQHFLYHRNNYLQIFRTGLL